MDTAKRILIAGEGHLSFQVFRKLKEKGYEPVRVESDKTKQVADASDEHSVYEHYSQKFVQAGIHEADVVYLIDDEDKHNIQFFLIASSLNPRARLVMSLFNDNLAPHLRGGHHSLEIYNPAAIAATEFTKASMKKMSKKLSVQSSKAPILKEHIDRSFRNALVAIFGIFLVILCVSTIVFHFNHNLTWIDAFYFASTVITTTGFGDISLLGASPAMKLFGIALMFVGVSFISVAFSFIVEWLLSRRSELALGRKQYTLRGHIIVCGLGRLGYQITLELLKKGFAVLVIEHNPENRFIDLVRGAGGLVFVADASLSRNLHFANMSHAASLFAVIQNDLKNLEIGLVARSLQPRLPLVLRIFDKDIASEMQKRLSIPTALSASAIAAEYLLKKL